MLARKFNEMLEPAGITINGGNPWDIQVHDRKWFGRILREKNLGLGESYMDGWWDCGRLDEMFHRLLRSGLEERIKGGLLYLSRLLPGSLVNLQSRRRSRMVAEQHYDLGNDLFFSFLDSHQQYSCGFSRIPTTSTGPRSGNCSSSPTSSISRPRITCSTSAAAGAASPAMRRSTMVAR